MRLREPDPISNESPTRYVQSETLAPASPTLPDADIETDHAPNDWDATPIKEPSVVTSLNAWLGKTWPNWAIATGLFSWLVFAVSSSRSTPLLCYPAIAIVGTGVTAILMRRFTGRKTKAMGIAATIVAVFVWGSYDTYDERWYKDNVRYVDTYKRWSGRHVYRDIDSYETSERIRLVWSGEGPIAGTGKLHGKWKYIHWEPSFLIDNRFYWYGEEVTEGEWHLRN